VKPVLEACTYGQAHPLADWFTLCDPATRDALRALPEKPSRDIRNDSLFYLHTYLRQKKLIGRTLYDATCRSLPFHVLHLPGPHILRALRLVKVKVCDYHASPGPLYTRIIAIFSRNLVPKRPQLGAQIEFVTTSVYAPLQRDAPPLEFTLVDDTPSLRARTPVFELDATMRGRVDFGAMYGFALFVPVRAKADVLHIRLAERRRRRPTPLTGMLDILALPPAPDGVHYVFDRNLIGRWMGRHRQYEPALEWGRVMLGVEPVLHRVPKAPIILTARPPGFEVDRLEFDEAVGESSCS
jgi:hypothetical protein